MTEWLIWKIQLFLAILQKSLPDNHASILFCHFGIHSNIHITKNASKLFKLAIFGLPPLPLFVNIVSECPLICNRLYFHVYFRKLDTAEQLANNGIGQVIRNIVENVEDLFQFWLNVLQNVDDLLAIILQPQKSSLFCK